MDKLDQSTKKQLTLLLAKTLTSQKPIKSIISSVPLAQIRKTFLKDQSTEASPAKIPLNFSSSPSTSRSPSSKLSPSKSLKPLIFEAEILTDISATSTTDVPMDIISVVPGSPIKIDKEEEIFLDAQSCDIIADDFNGVNDPNFIIDDLVSEDLTDVEIILNVTNLVKTSNSDPSSSEMRLQLQRSISSPSIPLRIKSLGLAAGTPLRAIYRNASATEIQSNNDNQNTCCDNQSTFNSYVNSSMRSSLLIDLIEEFCNTKEEECFKKIISLTSIRTGDFDGLTSFIVNKLFKSFSLSEVPFEFKLKLLNNFLKNDSFLLSQSGKEILEILEATDKGESGTEEEISSISTFISKSNLNEILLQNCIELCYERLSEFKLILLSEFIKNSVVPIEKFKEYSSTSVTPLLLVRMRWMI